MRSIDTLLINRISCTSDLKCDAKERSFVMNLLQKLQDCVYALARLYRKMSVLISAPKIFSFVIVVVVFVVVCVMKEF